MSCRNDYPQRHLLRTSTMACDPVDDSGSHRRCYFQQPLCSQIALNRGSGTCTACVRFLCDIDPALVSPAVKMNSGNQKADSHRVFAPKNSSSDVWLNFTQIADWPSMGTACLVAFTGPIYALIGPDSAVHMAEEVKDASKTIPWAMVSTLVLNGLTGLVMAITFAYCLGPIEAALMPEYNFALIGTFFNATQSRAGATVMTCIVTTLALCSAISNVATASRQMYAFARDSGLPFKGFLSYVRPGWDIPLNSVIVCFCCTALLSLINLGSMVAFNAILSIGVGALLTSYMTSIGCILLKRIRGEELLPRRWSLGDPFGWFCNIVGLVYVIIAFIFAFFPVYNHPNVMQMNWASAVYGGVAIVATVYYLLYARYIYVPPVSRLAKDL